MRNILKVLKLPEGAIPIAGDIRRNVPARNCAIKSRIERVEGFIGVKCVRVQVENLTEERRSASLIRQDDNVLYC